MKCLDPRPPRLYWLGNSTALRLLVTAHRRICGNRFDHSLGWCEACGLDQMKTRIQTGSYMQKFDLFNQHFVDLCLKNYPFFISWIRASYFLLRENGYEHGCTLWSGAGGGSLLHGNVSVLIQIIWNLFPSIQLRKCQLWFRKWVDALAACTNASSKLMMTWFIDAYIHRPVALS